MRFQLINSTGNVKNVLVFVFITAVLFGTIFILYSKKSKMLSFKARVYFSQNAQGTASLYSSNVKIERNSFPYCGAPVKGLKTYSGDFCLSFGKSKLNLGKMEFVENTDHSGNFMIRQLDRYDNLRDFIVIFQYGTCSWKFARFYGYDLKNKSLISYSFKWPGQKRTPEIALSCWVRDKFLEILPNRDFISRVYDNSICKFRASQWRLNDKENIFEGIDSWIEPKDGKNKIYSLIEETELPDKFKEPVQYKIDRAEFKIFPLKIENNEFGYFEAYNNGEKIYVSDKVFRISVFFVFKFKDNKYVIVKEDSGGAHCCFREYVFLLDKLQRLKLIRIFDLGNAQITADSLMEKDDKLYLIIKDDRFAYFHVAYPDSYFFNRYFLIEGDELIERNADFKNELVAEAGKWENDLNKIISKDDPVAYGSWIRLFLGKTVNYILAGEPEKVYRNWESLDKYYTKFYTSRGLREITEEIMNKMK